MPALYCAVVISSDCSAAQAQDAAVRFWSLGPQLAETVFDAGKRHAQVDLQNSAYNATVAFYRQTVLGAFQQIEDQLAALRILEQAPGEAFNGPVCTIPTQAVYRSYNYAD